MKSKSQLIGDISGKTVLLAYDDPQYKLEIVTGIIGENAKMGQQVQYLDFDLQFSSLLRNLSIAEKEKFAGISVFPYLTDDINDIFSISQLSNQGGIVVLDTFNTLQNLMLMGNLGDSVVANHRTAVVISTLEELTRFYSKTLLILSLTRSRPRKTSEATLWERDIIGGRMTRFKSDLMLYARVTIMNGKRAVSIDALFPKENGSYELSTD